MTIKFNYVLNEPNIELARDHKASNVEYQLITDFETKTPARLAQVSDNSEL